MQQSKKASAIEAVVNIVIGMGVAYLSQIIVFPIVGIHNTPASTHLQITMWFTLISFARSYVIRRFFATKIHELSLRAARVKAEQEESTLTRTRTRNGQTRRLP